jgi:sulfite exporter TauE/SafE
VTLRSAAGPLPLLRHFAIQTAAWGAINLAIVLWAQRGLKLRDYAGARQLDRILWLNLGLDVGYIAVGITLAVAGWVLGRRLGAVGAGIGIVVQGAVLFLLDLVLVRQLITTV